MIEKAGSAEEKCGLGCIYWKLQRAGRKLFWVYGWNYGDWAENRENYRMRSPRITVARQKIRETTVKDTRNYGGQTKIQENHRRGSCRTTLAKPFPGKLL